MITIHKFLIDRYTTVTPIKLPVTCQPLKVDMQDDELCVWIQLDTEIKKENVTFYVFSTGDNLDFHQMEELTYLGTVLYNEGATVKHIYYK